MNNPWQDLFNTWLESITPKQEKKVKRYGITFTTLAKVYVEVDASDSDEAVDMAWDYLQDKDAEFEDWEVQDVDMVDPRA